MAKSFRVCPGGMVILPNQELARPGEVLHAHQFDRKVIESLLASRHIVEIANEPDVGMVRGNLVERPPGVEITPSHQAVMKLTRDGEDVISQKIETTEHNGPPIRVPSSAKSDTSPWVLDPAILQGKTVEELNALIQERDKKAPNFDTPEEASAFLSQDFKPRQ